MNPGRMPFDIPYNVLQTVHGGAILVQKMIGAPIKRKEDPRLITAE